MKIPKRLQPLVDDGVIDSVVRQLMSGKEAMVFVVRCGAQSRCAKVYKEARELMQAPLDAIMVSTPNFTHAQMASDILAAGKHLFLEKRDAEGSLQNRLQRIVVISDWFLFLPACQVRMH